MRIILGFIRRGLALTTLSIASASAIALAFALAFAYAHENAYAGAIDPNSCECPKLSCNSECEVEQDLTFYSEKCDSGKRVKSCARPTCVPIQNAPASCLAKKGDDSGALDRAPASAAAKKSDPVGKVTFIEGTLNRSLGADKRLVMSVGDEVSEGDRLETDSSSKAQVVFNSGNQMNLTPNSVVVISEASDSDPKDSKKRVLLDLIKGRIRNKVNQSYTGDQSYFRVKTGTAVAGVRGTDFVVSVSLDDSNYSSKVETLEGKVELSDATFAKKTYVAKGETSSFVAPKEAVFSDKDKSEFLAKGYLTPVYQLSEEQIAKLQNETNFMLAANDSKSNKKRKPKMVHSEDLPICAAPSGRLNECSWTCENNPSGESRCRTDLVDVQCVRRICNANGVWSQPTRLPASHRESCKGSSAVVKPCDY